MAFRELLGNRFREAIAAMAGNEGEERIKVAGWMGFVGWYCKTRIKI